MDDESKDASKYVFPVMAGSCILGVQMAPPVLRFALGYEAPLVTQLAVALVVFHIIFLTSEMAFAYVVGRFFPRWNLTQRLRENPTTGVFGPTNRIVRRLYEIGRAQASWPN